MITGMNRGWSPSTAAWFLVTPMCSRTRRTSAMWMPATRAVPDDGRVNVVSIRAVVVLPDPLRPRYPKISPRVTAKLTPATATYSP